MQKKLYRVDTESGSAEVEVKEFPVVGESEFHYDYDVGKGKICSATKERGMRWLFPTREEALNHKKSYTQKGLEDYSRCIKRMERILYQINEMLHKG